ncbi:MAG: hypothetical protein FJ125_17010 [Deltaproteobacteria bacterium]|nr:hypothetical protein [Deltaproteobacteria bacterium]
MSELRPLRSPAAPCKLLQQALPWLVVVLLAGLAGCNLRITPDRSSGPDGERYSAPGAKLNLVYNDSVDYDNGDATDWRFVLIGQQGILTLTCHFDEIDAKTVVHIRDAVGNIMAEQFHNGQPRQELTAKVNEGKYYLEVKAMESGSASPYTCEPKFDPVVWN